MAEAGAPTCTEEELRAIIVAPSGGLTMLPSTALDEVYPGLFVGEEYVFQSILCVCGRVYACLTVCLFACYQPR